MWDFDSAVSFSGPYLFQSNLGCRVGGAREGVGVAWSISNNDEITTKHDESKQFLTRAEIINSCLTLV